MTDGPAYRRIADALRSQIRAGELPPGAKLPSLSELAEQHNVSTGVAREAIVILRAEGLLESRQGAGNYVRVFSQIPRSNPGRLARAQWGTGKAIQDHDTQPRPRTVDVVVSESAPPADVANMLDLPAGAMAIIRARRFMVEDRPVQLATSYYVAEMVRGTAVMLTDTGAGGVYARLAEIGHEPVRFAERIISRAPHPDEAADLALPVTGGHVFDITRQAFTADEQCIEVNRMILDVAAYVLEYQFTA